MEDAEAPSAWRRSRSRSWGLDWPLRGDPSSFESCRCRFAGCELGDGGPRAGIVTARRATEDGADKFATGSEMKRSGSGGVTQISRRKRYPRGRPKVGCRL